MGGINNKHGGTGMIPKIIALIMVVVFIATGINGLMLTLRFGGFGSNVRNLANTENEIEDECMNETSYGADDYKYNFDDMEELSSNTDIDDSGNEGRLNILILGDICFGTSFGRKHKFQDVYDEQGAGYFFSGVQDEFEKNELIVANIENVFTTMEEHQESKIYTYKADPMYLNILKESGITYFGVVNNHMGDYLQSGFDDSIKNFNLSGIEWFGTNELSSGSVELGDIIVDRKQIFEEGGFKVGLVAYNGFYESYATDEMIIRDMEYFKRDNMDYIIALVHWGGQNTHDVTPRQKSYGRHLVDMGIDLVIGGHPHAIQEVEEYKGKRIYYSLGDFLFVERSTPKYPDSLMVKLSLTRREDGSIVEDFENIPALWSGGRTGNTFRPIINKNTDDIKNVLSLIKI